MTKRTIIATFEIVTPMFLGDADHQATRIRESSIKGALAFWWRALNYSRFVDEAGGDPNVALKSMQKQEQELFGGPKGQGGVLLQVADIENPKVLDSQTILGEDGNNVANPRPHDDRTVGVGARYLGYGLLNAYYSPARDGKPKKEAGELDRSCFKLDQSFTIKLVFKRSLSKSDVVDIIRALEIFGLLGGLGSRIRRGWGSVTMVKMVPDNIFGLDEWCCPKTVDAYEKKLKKIIGDSNLNHCGSNFKVTAFSRKTDIRVGDDKDINPLVVLDRLGIGFMKYRSRGKPKGKAGGYTNRDTGNYIGGFDVDASFIEDHDWYHRTKDTDPKSVDAENWAPMRTAFGLPQNYSKYYGVTASEENDRRASPLMFHIQKIDNCYYPVAAFFPNRFLPADKCAVWKDKQDISHKKDKDYIFDPDVISDFLNGYTHQDDKMRKPASPPMTNPYFPSKKVFP